MLLELKSLSDARDASRKQAGSKGGQDAGCHCAVALGMLPLNTTPDVLKTEGEETTSTGRAAQTPAVDKMTEDQTDRVLYKIEASMERLRELAEMIQATSMQGEANLISKVTLQDGAIKALASAIQASAATATATAIAQERGRSSSAFGRLYLPIQIKKLQEWYYSYPRPLMDELTLMRTILNYKPYANPFQVGGLTIAHVRDWFKRRRHRERVRFIKLTVEAGRDPVAAEEEINLRLEQRIAHLRASVDPNELVKELDRVRNESSTYESMVNAFTQPSNLESYISASDAVPTSADLRNGTSGSSANNRHKRLRTQESDVDDAVIVKPSTQVEVQALQNRVRSLVTLPRTATNTNALQQVVDILRAMTISVEMRIQTGIVADLKQILKIYKKPTLLRKSTIALLETLGMNRRAILDETVVDEQPPPPPPPPIKTELPVMLTEDDAMGQQNVAPSSAVDGDDAPDVASDIDPSTSGSKGIAKSGGKKKAKVLRPMKFSMHQVTALEAWFQQKYKPTQAEMEEYLAQLNSPPLRDEKQSVDVNMTQLRRWFNKRRCLRRPPFALMTQQDAAREGGKDEEDGKKLAGQMDGDEMNGNDSMDLNDSSDEDDSSDDEDE